ncbi:two-component system sensor histidine kinase NtrB [Terriglobus sp.]|uniref:two-component system sensor histidine kinase NtrB n=1 Tax=Terriglobus sp. TaxID=1889013 RepID=UPI003B006537
MTLAADVAAPDDFFQNAPCGCAVLAMDGTILRANSIFQQLTGVALGSGDAPRWQQLLSRAGAIYYETQFSPVVRLRGAVKEVAFDLLQPGRERIPVLVSANLQKNLDGIPVAIRLTLFEASERRTYEAELLRARNRAERMAEVVQHSSDAIVALSPDGIIQGWNIGAEQMFGYSHAEVTNRALSAVIFPPDRQHEIPEALTLLRRGEDILRDTVGHTKSGREIHLSISLTPHMEAPGTLVAFSAIIRDVTARKLTEKALLQNEKLASVGRLASSIAHEINNPLESITNLLYILDGMATDPAMKSYINIAQDEIARVSQIATHTLRFHRQSTSRSDLDVRNLFDSTLVLYRARLLNAGITTQIDFCDSTPLFCFEGELRQIVANLVGNAFDAMRTGGRLRLRSRRIVHPRTGTGGLRLTLADTGSGMSAETLSRIFEPFFSTKGIGGTGLGLWITQELLEKNGGTIRVRSSMRPGRSGTVFHLFFARERSGVSVTTSHSTDRLATAPLESKLL